VPWCKRRGILRRGWKSALLAGHQHVNNDLLQTAAGVHRASLDGCASSAVSDSMLDAARRCSAKAAARRDPYECRRRVPLCAPPYR
jgi:hypothetical protein